MKTRDIRKKFLDYFAGHGHEVVASSPGIVRETCEILVQSQTARAVGPLTGLAQTPTYARRENPVLPRQTRQPPRQEELF